MATRGPGRTRYCSWLPAAHTVLSKHGHAPLVELPVFQSLKKRGQHMGPASVPQWLIEDWNTLQESMKDKWQSKGDAGILFQNYKGPFLLAENWCLRSLFKVFDKHFFDGALSEMFEIVCVKWERDNKQQYGYTESDVPSSWVSRGYGAGSGSCTPATPQSTS